MLNIKHISFSIIAMLLLALSLPSLSKSRTTLLGVKNNETELNKKPLWLEVKDTFFYDADVDDLVTAGIGFSKLSYIKIENIFNNPNSPTQNELRRAKLNRNIDTKNGEGYLFGFQKSKLTPLFDGKIAGYEVQAYLNDGDQKVGLLLQVPLDFDVKKPCIVAVPTMDFEGVYNAKDFQIRGLWGLRNNCAVVYNDKGLGNALFDFSSKQGYLINGQAATQDSAGDELLFFSNAKVKSANQYSLKGLHSQQNSEQKWGEYLLKSIEFSFYQLNDMFSPNYEIILDKNNTHVLVYGMSDGAGAALRAGEQDSQGIIDGIVAVNPQIQIANNQTIPLLIKKGELPIEPLQTKSLIDYSSYLSLYIPCAIGALKEQPLSYQIPDINKFLFAESRCSGLKKAELLSAETFKEQTNEALEKLAQYGINEKMINQLPHYYYTNFNHRTYQYISGYGRYALDDELCDYSVASIDQEILFNEGAVAPLTKTNFARLWANNSGSLPIKIDNDIVAIDLVNNNDPNGPRRDFYSRSTKEGKIDYNLSGAICLRNKVLEQRVNKGLNKVFATGNLNQIKTIIVHGQLNVLNHPDNSSRAYVALNSYMESSLSNLKYIEVENASYLDGIYPFDNTLVSMDYYGENAMDWMWNNITKKASLPDSQVVRANPRGGNVGFAPPVSQKNLVPIAQTAKKVNQINVNNGTIILPK